MGWVVDAGGDDVGGIGCVGGGGVDGDVELNGSGGGGGGDDDDDDDLGT